MEAQGLEYLEKVRQGFLTEAQRNPNTILVINADRPAEEVHTEVLRHAEQALSAPTKLQIQNPKSKI
jgi:thymidylate kinase